MGFFTTLLSFIGFGLGIPTRLVIGYFMFIYFEPSEVQVGIWLLFFLFYLDLIVVLVICFYSFG